MCPQSAYIVYIMLFELNWSTRFFFIYIFSLRNKGSNTGKRARRKNLRHPRERFLAGIWDFFVLPSYGCLILFLTNLPILYVFRCFILFLTKHLCFVYIPSSVFPQNCFPLVKLIVDLSIYIRVLAIF